MNTYTSAEYTSEVKNVIALGCFDGIHIGHQKVISTAVKLAQANSVSSLVWTFEMSPKNHFQPNSVPMLTDLEEKEEIVSSLAVDTLVCVKFTDISELSPKQFFVDILVNKLKATHIVCGFNYNFGKNAEGNIDLLEKLCKAHDIGMTVIDPVSIDGITVSSSKIRELLFDGKASYAAKLLGHPYSILAEVTDGQKLARRLGFPTANQIFPYGMLVPKKGVYVTQVTVNNKLYHGITNVGIRPTANDHTL